MPTRVTLVDVLDVKQCKLEGVKSHDLHILIE